jgi:4-hydroxythreonine-4-phosphate dehydrogenase
MIYVTQGHEKGIGLEIFLKSFLLLSKKEQQEIALVCDESILKKNLADLNLSEHFFSNLKIIPNIAHSSFHSTNSLLTSMNLMRESDVLVTLPTSKDQLIYENKHCAGYTEFFRAFYKNSNLPMTFMGLGKNLLLITDHISLLEVGSSVNSDLIVEKTKMTLDNYKKYFTPIDEVIFAGINPHAGEGGILGVGEEHIKKAIQSLSSNYGPIFSGPFSGDTLHTKENQNKNQLFVYMFHDQALASFKSQYGLIGLNITLGLPFLRLSVDHGTAFDLYGKNKANATSMIYLFKKAFEVTHVHQRN